MSQKFNFAPAVAYAVLAMVAGATASARSRYLIAASRKISVGRDLIANLRPAKWAYTMPCYVTMFGAAIGIYGFYEPLAGLMIFGGIGLSCICGGIWWLNSLWNSTVSIAEGKLTYVAGKSRTEIESEEICAVSISWFNFRVRLRWQREVTIPATFESSEIILAFLIVSSDANRSKKDLGDEAL